MAKYGNCAEFPTFPLFPFAKIVTEKLTKLSIVCEFKTLFNSTTRRVSLIELSIKARF